MRKKISTERGEQLRDILAWRDYLAMALQRDCSLSWYIEQDKLTKPSIVQRYPHIYALLTELGRVIAHNTSRGC